MAKNDAMEAKFSRKISAPANAPNIRPVLEVRCLMIRLASVNVQHQSRHVPKLKYSMNTPVLANALTNHRNVRMGRPLILIRVSADVQKF